MFIRWGMTGKVPRQKKKTREETKCFFCGSSFMKRKNQKKCYECGEGL